MSHIKNVAIIGATGHIGKPLFDALYALGTKTITVVTRESSTHTFPSDVKVAKVNYDSHDSIVSALKGQEFLVISLSVMGPQDLHGKVCKAAGEAGVPYIMPNVFGQDVTDEKFRNQVQWAKMSYQRVQEVKEAGVAWFALANGFWYEWSVALGTLGDQWYGIQIKDRKVTFYDDGKTKMWNSTWNQCGRGFAALLSLPKEEFESFKNSPVTLGSFSVSQRDILDSVHRVLGTSDKDFEIKYEATEQREKDGLAEQKAGDFRGFAKMLYAANFNYTKQNGHPEFENGNKKLGAAEG